MQLEQRGKIKNNVGSIEEILSVTNPRLTGGVEFELAFLKYFNCVDKILHRPRVSIIVGHSHNKGESRPLASARRPTYFNNNKY